jgi:hypothetical protein
VYVDTGFVIQETYKRKKHLIFHIFTSFAGKSRQFNIEFPLS